MDAFDTTIAAAAICGLVIGVLIAGSWFGGLLGFRMGAAFSGLLFLVVCVDAAGLLERRKRRGKHR